MSSARHGLVIVSLAAIAAAAFLYNKQLNLEVEKQRAALQEQLYQHQLKCAENGATFAIAYLAEERSAKLPGGDTAWDTPEYHYNTELRTCLVRTRFIDMWPTVTVQHARVTDLSSNKAVIESYVRLTPDPNKKDGSLNEEVTDVFFDRPNLTRNAFVAQADALMKK